MSVPKNESPGTTPPQKPDEAASALTVPQPTELTQPRPTAVGPMKSTAINAADAAEGTTWSAKRPVMLGVLTIVLLVGGFMTWALV
ncbi:MAG: hypothetical protein H7245_04085, partial [Candidatus Saccharibacteria bacterium]|nr:hypothetical protein [Pseudorhodobacter sp.]